MRDRRSLSASARPVGREPGLAIQAVGRLDRSIMFIVAEFFKVRWSRWEYGELGALPLPIGERVGVRGFRPRDRPGAPRPRPAPLTRIASRSDLSPLGRGGDRGDNKSSLNECARCDVAWRTDERYSPAR